MYTIAETETFKNKAAKLLKEDERLFFFAQLSQNPYAGDVIPNGGGLR